MSVAAWEQAQRRQRNAVKLATRELLEMAAKYPTMTPDQFILIYQALVDKYGSVSVSIALRAIENSRRAAGFWEVLPEPGPADLVATEQMEATFAWAVKQSDGDVQALAWKLASPLGRLVQQRGRHTVWNATVQAGTRYARLPGPQACHFCLMLGSRGAVYTKDTVTSTVGARRSRRPEGLKFHDHCDCQAIEAYSVDDLPQVIIDLRDEWYEVTTGKNGQSLPNQAAVWREHIRLTRPNSETVRPKLADLL